MFIFFNLLQYLIKRIKKCPKYSTIDTRKMIVEFKVDFSRYENYKVLKIDEQFLKEMFLNVCSNQIQSSQDPRKSQIEVIKN